jgi:hypothetical protein
MSNGCAGASATSVEVSAALAAAEISRRVVNRASI